MRRGAVVALWLAALAACALVAARASYTGDLTAFLPRSTTPDQALLVAQLRDGVAARVVLLAIEGAPPEALVESSRALVRRLRENPRIAYVANGEGAVAKRDRDLLFEHRYLLSPAVTPAAFDVAGLRASLEASAAALASPAGALVRSVLPRDPTGAAAALLAQQADRAGPPLREGVWFDPAQVHGTAAGRALLMLETRAAGFDADAQAALQAEIVDAFAATRADPAARLVMSGPGVFAVESRARIERDARRLSALAALGVAAVLLAAYRRLAFVAASAIPVATGLLVGIAAVGLGFGTIHGITLGFGATLVGEAADYSTYLLAQRMRGESLGATAARVWPTLRLAVLTTAFGATAMLASSFAGLAQLGLLTFVGAAAAGIATRFVLPAVVPDRWAAHDAPRAPRALDRIAAAPRRLKPLVPLALLAALAFLAAAHDRLWENELARLNPIPLADQQRDQSLRAALAAPDARQLLVVRGDTREAVLQRLEGLAPRLARLVEDGLILSFDSAARYLPSEAAQRARQAALPERDVLAARLAEANAGLPFRDELFAPFLADVARARGAPPLGPDDLDGTAWGVAVRALLRREDAGWVGLAPLAGVKDARALAAAVGEWRASGVTLLDLKTESDAMVAAYRDQSLALGAVGVVLVAAVLALGLRNARAVLDVLLPVLAALAATAALLVGAGTRLTLLHLVALLLVLGIGTNYSLFFARRVADAAERGRNVYAVLVATSTTVIAFGALATSDTTVLRAIGVTVTLGASLALVFAAAWSQHGEAAGA